MPKHSHPCNHCVHLDWDIVNSDHGTPIRVPYCGLDYHLAIATCACYEKG